ncbi:MAG TPA: rhodanese-like domain-containing protein [Armatimonadota bacterium]|nr:rhodanese-like domain-containing protein [Armatimonadota bacterium]
MMSLSVVLTMAVAGAVLLTGCAVAPAAEDASAPGAGTYRTITPAEAKARLAADPTIRLVDVRTPEEYREQHLPGSILIPEYELAARAPSLLPKKDATIFLYCRSGRRSREAALTLLALGYPHVYDLGGIMSWPYETAAGP